jgi:hypothetical protein
MFKRNVKGAVTGRREIARAEGGPQGTAVAFAALVKLERKFRLNHVPAAFAFFRPLLAGDRFRHFPR